MQKAAACESILGGHSGEGEPGLTGLGLGSFLSNSDFRNVMFVA